MAAMAGIWAMGFTALLLLAPASAAHSGSEWAILTVAGVSFAGAVLTSRRPPPSARFLPAVLTGLLAAAAVTGNAAYEATEWRTLFSLLAVAVGVVAPLRVAPWLV